ncbi:MAG: GTP cyclohydrolase MptA [Aeropyrum sp.]|nr:GTP cyclohydrolase MptA [Aeropyrum sp.]MCE4616535.1 GTP cyclohydrolase MptA [Aeropyrum sp.]
MDVQDLTPDKPLYLERVGFRGVRKRAVLESPEGPLALDLELDAYVDLEPSKRGVHLSRNIEAIESVISDRRARSIEDLLRKIGRELLERHSYAAKSSVVAKTLYYVKVEWLHGLASREPVDVEVEVSVTRGGEELWRVSVEARGMTVCPSARQTIAEIKGLDPELAPSHSQKAVLRGTVTTRRVMVRIEDLARELFSSFSAPTITLLKKRHEAGLILAAFSKPMFVEDIVREAAWRIANIPYMPEDAIIEVEALSFESIHPHDLSAYLRARASEVRAR